MTAISGWSFAAFCVTEEPFVRFISASMTIAFAFAMTTRNFAIYRGSTLEIVSTYLPLSAAMIVGGGWYPWAIVLGFIPLALFMRGSSKRVRANFLGVVAAQRKVAKLAKRLDMALNNMSHGLLMVDAKGCVTVANRQIVNLFRLDAADVQPGQSLRAVGRKLMRRQIVAPSEVERVWKTLAQAKDGATATLAMGDALAVAVLEARGFTAQDFARSHPGGALGRRLLLHVEDLMRTGDAVPRVPPDAPLSAGLLEMSRKGLGMTVVVDRADTILGVFTDGDLRRALDKQIDVHATVMSAVMTVRGRPSARTSWPRSRCTSWRCTRSPHLPVADEQRTPDRCAQRARPDARRRRVRDAHRPAWCAPSDCWSSTSTACSPTGGCISARAARPSRSFTCATATASCSCAAPGCEVAVISGRRSRMVNARCRELGVRHLYQGVSDKLAVLQRLLARLKLQRPPAPAWAMTCRICP